MVKPDGILRVVIAADSAMHRDIVRFFLNEDGFEIVGDAARAEDAAWMAAKFGADAVILQETIAADEAQEAIHRLRTEAPATAIVVFTPEGSSGPANSAALGADAYLEEGVGLVDLALLLRSLGGVQGIEPIRVPDVAPVPPVPVGIGATGSRAEAAPLVPEFGLDAKRRRRSMSSRASIWLGGGRQRLVPVLAGAAALLLAVALVASRSSLGDALFPQQAGAPQVAGLVNGPDASVYVEASFNRLDALVVSLQGFDVEEAPRLARELVEERARAVESGATEAAIAELDQIVEAKLRPVIRTAPERVAAAVLTILAPVYPWAEEDLGDFIADGIVPPETVIPNDAFADPTGTDDATASATTSDPGPSTNTSGAGPGAGDQNGGGSQDGSGNDNNSGGNQDDNGGNDNGGNDNGGNDNGGNDNDG
ncbi:MAG: hypothetical protein WEA10_00200, partial [Actinomycetota bacterium]